MNQEEKQQFNEMKEMLETIHKIVLYIYNNNLSKNLENLAAQIILRKILSVNEIIRMYGISRPWALQQMKKLSDTHPYFEFIKGDRRFNRESKIKYCELKEQQQVFDKLFDLMESNDEVVFAKINKFLSSFSGGDFERTRGWIYKFVDKSPDKYIIKDENRLCKRS